MKELKVGERVTITLEAVEQKTCKGCFFDNYGVTQAICLNVVMQTVLTERV